MNVCVVTFEVAFGLHGMEGDFYMILLKMGGGVLSVVYVSNCGLET
jgi:hypothetical protein